MPGALRLASGVLLWVFAAAGCAGAGINVTAAHARYPVSLSPLVRDASGRIYDRRSLDKVGTFDARKTTVGFFYSALAVPWTRDFSDEINAQVAAAGGEAIVGLTITAGRGCAPLSGFPFLNVLPIWPGCVPVRLTGDIVRRRDLPQSPTISRSPRRRAVPRSGAMSAAVGG